MECQNFSSRDGTLRNNLAARPDMALEAVPDWIPASRADKVAWREGPHRQPRCQALRLRHFVPALRVAHRPPAWCSRLWPNAGVRPLNGPELHHVLEPLPAEADDDTPRPGPLDRGTGSSRGSEEGEARPREDL